MSETETLHHTGSLASHGQGMRLIIPVVMTAFMGVSSSGIYAWYQWERNADASEAAIEHEAFQLTERVRHRFQLYEYGLRGARGTVIVAGEEGMTRALFKRYSESRDIDKEFPGARGIGIIRRVPEARLNEFVDQERRHGAPAFAVKQFAPTDGERFLIQFIEPLERNTPALGLDVRSEANRRHAAEQAMWTGEATLTAPITLVQNSGERQRSLLLMLPIYRSGMPIGSPQQREAACYGWSYAPLALKEVMADFNLDNLALSLRDVTADPEGELFFDTRPSGGAGETLLSAQREIEVFGRSWRIVVKGDARFVASLHQPDPWKILLLGTFLSGLMSALVGSIAVGRERRRAGFDQRARLATIVENSADAIVGESMDGLVINWNRAAERMFGYREDEAIGRSLASLLLPEERRHEELELIERIRQGEVLTPFDATRTDRWGRSIEVSITASAIRSGSGRTIGVAKLIRDIRDRKDAERSLQAFNATLERQVEERTGELARERERLASIIEGTRTGTWEWHVKTGDASFNEQWARIIGHDLQDLSPVNAGTWFDRVHPEDRRQLEDRLRLHFDGAVDFFECEARMRHKDGGWVWVLERGRVISRADDGTPLWMYGTHQDISAIKAAQGELSRVLGLLRLVLDAATEISIIATDEQGLITVFNAGAEQMLGYRASEMVGRSTPAILHLPQEVEARERELSLEFDAPVTGFRVFVQKAELDGGETRAWTYVRKDGQHLTVSLTVTAIREESGALAGYLGVALDITDRLRRDAALMEAKAVAEKANTAKSLFLANMSHEIRTPMNAVIGAAYLLEGTNLDPDQRQLLRKIAVAGRSLLGIINDVLDLSKIEAGEFQVESSPFDPMEVINDVEQLFAEQARGKGVDFRISGHDAVPDLLIGDAMRLRQILINLVGNAIKFTARGHVSLHVERDGDGHAPMWLKWSVRDTGLGISADALGKLFTAFTQADASTTRRFGGTGLGLSIVRQLSELMGGKAGATSELGRGSEFWVRLPFEIVDDAGEQARVGMLRVVVVDDSAADRGIIAGLCRRLGWHVTELTDGLELVSHCKRLAESGKLLPDALLVDWQMPGLDGLQALAKLAESLDVERLPAALIVSAHEALDIVSNDTEGRADSVLTKPVTPSELFNAVNACVSRRTGSFERVVRATRMDAVGAMWLQDLNILLVDDSEINLYVGRRLLEREGALVETCFNGREAVACLQARGREFDAVLMDVHMPEMDGHEATMRLRELGFSALPVIALTAGALREERAKAEAAGMNDFLTKPLEPALLIRTLRRAIEQARGQPLPLASASAAQVAHKDDDWPRIEGLDMEGVAHRFGGDLMMFKKVLTRLLQDFDRDFPMLDRMDASSAARLRQADFMHKLKGTTGLLGATGIHRLASQLETALRQAGEAGGHETSFALLVEAMANLRIHARALLIEDDDSDFSSAEDVAEADVRIESGIGELMACLMRQDLAALAIFNELEPLMQGHGESKLAGQLRRSIDALDFDSAAALLRGRYPALSA